MAPKAHPRSTPLPIFKPSPGPDGILRFDAADAQEHGPRPQGCPRDAAALLQLPEGEVLVAVMLQGRPAPRRGLVLLARGEEGEMAVAQRGAELPEGWQVVGVAV